MTVSLQNARFYYSAPSPCPYLAGRMERRIFADLGGAAAAAHYDLLSEAGFRRSLGFAYRPACPGCNACVPVRMPVAAFRPDQRCGACSARNADLPRESRPARATTEQYELFTPLPAAATRDGEMARDGFRRLPRDGRGSAPIDTRSSNSATATARWSPPAWSTGCATGFLPSTASSIRRPAAQPGQLHHPVAGRAKRGATASPMSIWATGSRPAARWPTRREFRPLEALTRDGWRLMDEG